ncbi:MAG: hypothetical protein N4A72_04645 [Bacteroidales bacterium]|nr:hypothetical protein [Bacteroidales bacterium]
MRKLLFLIMMYCCINGYAQEVLFKDHLFNDHTKSVEVKHDDDIFTITFQEGEPIKLYSWEYKTVLKAIRSNYIDIRYSKFTMEVGRLFYEVKGKTLLIPKVKNRSLAGVMGFKSDYVYLIKGDFKDYKKAAKQSVGLFVKPESGKYDDNIYTKVQHIINYYETIGSVKSYQSKLDNADKKLAILEKELSELDSELNILNNSTRDYNDLQELVYREIKRVEKRVDMDIIEELLFEKKTYNVLNIPDSALTGDFRPLLQYKYLVELRKYEKDLIYAVLNDTTDDSEFVKSTNHIVAKFSPSSDNRKKQIEKIKEPLQKEVDSLKKEKVILNKNEYKEYFNYNIVIKANIDSVNVEITETFIERIMVFCTLEYLNEQENDKYKQDKHITLINKAPYGISTLKEIERTREKGVLFANINGKIYSVKLRDIFTFYRPELKNKRRDVSPADTTFMVVKGKRNGDEVKLFRQTSERLFEFKIFSDFVGIDGTKANGLVQTEFDKKMFLSPRKYYGFFGGYTGFFTYIKPTFTLSKLEDNNKYAVPLISGDNKYINTLDLMRHQIYKVGADFNLQMFHISGLKSDMYIDFGAYYSRSGISDTIKKSDSGLDVVILEPKVKFKVQTDERYFVCIDGSVKFTRLLDSDVKQLRKYDSQKGVKNVFNDPYYTLSVMAGYSPTANTRGKLFFRYRYSGALRDGARLGYSQIQLGYSYYFNL